MRPQEVVDHIESTVRSTANLPSKTNFIEEEPDNTGEHAAIKLPIVSFDIASVTDLDVFNTDLDEIVTDGSGNSTGRIFRAEYELGLQIDVLTAAESQYSRDELGTDVWNSLYKYSDEGPAQNLHKDIWMVRIDDEDTVDDFGMNPTLRTWRLNLTVGSFNEYETTDDFIADFAVEPVDVN